PGEYAPARQPAIRQHVEREGLQAVGVVHIQCLLVSTQMNAVRTSNAFGNPDRGGTGWNVIHSRRESRLGLAELLLLDWTQAGVGGIPAAVAVDSHSVRPAEGKAIETLRESGFLARRPHNANAGKARLGLE